MALERGKGSTRRLSNANETAELFENMTGRQWTRLIGDEPQSILERAALFNTVELLFAVHGAGCVSILYMQRDTAFIEVHDSWRSLAYWNISRIVRLYHVISKIKTLEHNGRGDKDMRPLPAEVAEAMLVKAISLLETSPRWKARGRKGNLRLMPRMNVTERRQISHEWTSW